MFLPSNGFSEQSWVKPIKDLSRDEKLAFWTGFSLFRSPWVAAPASTEGRDGLGPLFNARSCDACHASAGAGKLPAQGFGAVIRLSAYDNKSERYRDHPSYGVQLQTHSIASITGADEIPAEGKVHVRWQTVEVAIAGRTYELRQPNVDIQSLNYGPLSGQQSLRLAPVLFGLAWADSLSEKDILANEDINDGDNNGISGKANRVWDIAKKKYVIGRFGFKAEQPNLLQQIAAAFSEDIGISSWLYPNQACRPEQIKCGQTPNGNSGDEGVEISQEKLELVTYFTKNIDYPHYNIEKEKSNGAQLFEQVGCASCHLNKSLSLNNSSKIPALYSDFLLHSMGEGLSDNRPVFDALGDEWRTTSLLGISRKLNENNTHLLHDGRARSIMEAVLWHGGEAASSRDRLLALNQDQKIELFEFIKHL